MTNTPKVLPMRNKKGIDALNNLCKDIAHIIDECSSTFFLEIGAYTGDSTVIFAKNFPLYTIVTVDPFEPGFDSKDETSNSDFKEVYKIFKRNIKGMNIVHHKKTSDVFFESTRLKYAGCYIDGNHSYNQVVKDLENAKRVVEDGGIIAGHDYFHPNSEEIELFPHLAQVYRAVNNIIGKPKKVYEDGSWFVINN